MSALGRLVVVWRITEACDLDCWFCEYARRHGGARRAARGADVLAFGASLGQYAAAAGREVLVSWLGGEPMLWPPLRRVDRELHEEHGLQLGATTNGTHLDAPGMIDHLVRHYRELTISVDGPAALHDAGRVAPGLYQRLRAGVGALREEIERQGRGLLLRANLLLTRSSVRAFESTCHSLAGWGIEEITFNGLGGRPAGPHYADERLRPDDLKWLRSVLPDIRQALAARGVSLRGSEQYLGRLELQARGHPWPVQDCRPGEEFLFVDDLGRAAPCAFTSDDFGVPIAELNNAAGVERLPQVYRRQREHAPAAACADCLSTQVAGKFAL